jgi:phosphoribosylglycinamide formyltransferase-1
MLNIGFFPYNIKLTRWRTGNQPRTVGESVVELKLGFLASHEGSNMQAIIDACMSGRLEAEPRVVISNNSSSPAIERARREGIPYFHLSSRTHPMPEDLDRGILDALEAHQVNLVVLAGYMKRLGHQTLSRYPGRILNIHPALLPMYGGKGMFGKRVHEAVLAAGERVTGVTIHKVDQHYDQGEIVAQCEVTVVAGDTVDSLGERVLRREHEFYVETLQQISHGEIDLGL